ncbi:MAG: transposase family protein [Neisseriaceae bacterium]|nr:transposase family protein [Neisseriaceae bacterium]MBQ9725812.1 transposase family protein [Neisseriaceae bacterium]
MINFVYQRFALCANKPCFPLDIVDDCSRFCISIRANDSTAQMVIPVFQAAFDEYGLPDAILSDNGAQFAGFRGGFTQFEKWLMNLDILPIHGRAYQLNPFFIVGRLP